MPQIQTETPADLPVGDRVRVWIVRSGGQPAAGATITAGEVIYPPGASLGPLVRRGYGLFLVHEGRMDVELDERRLRVSAGEVALMKPGGHEFYRFATDGPTRYSWLTLVNPPPAPEVLHLLAAAPAGALPATTTAPAMAALVAAAARLAERVPLPHAALEALVVSAFALHAEEAHALGLLGGTARPHPAVVAACEAVHRNLDQRMGLGEMAQAAHVAPAYLVHLFRQELHTTPVRYLWAQRVRFGIHLLQDTGLPIKEVATRAGFQSSYHFSRLVRATTGLPPRDHRRRSWNAGGPGA